MTGTSDRPQSPHSLSTIPTHNAKGGLYVSLADVHTAFAFLDPSATGTITATMIHAKLLPFYPAISISDCEFLLNGSDCMSEAELFELLSSNQLTNYDPIAEAFKIYDIAGTGAMDADTLRAILVQCGFKDLNRNDLMALMGLLDKDGDGKVSMNDFRCLLQTPAAGRAGQSSGGGPALTSPGNRRRSVALNGK